MVLAAVLCLPSWVALATSVKKLTVRVGEQLEFAAAPGVRGSVVWRLDGQFVSDTPRWVFAPAAADVGTHRVTMTADAGERSSSRDWHVRVRMPRSLRVEVALPGAEVLEVPANAEIELRFEVTSREEGERVAVSWLADGKAAGEGPVLRIHRKGPATVRVRALASGSLGAAVVREWRVTFGARTPPSTAEMAQAVPPMTSERVARPVPPAEHLAPPVAPTLAPQVASAPPPRASPGRDEVAAFLGELAAAWRQGNVTALRQLGQVTSDEQATALTGYFSGVRDLDVAIELQDLTTRADRTVVRFVRRDTFRSPTGEMVTKISPALEKEVVRDSSGHLRFGTMTR